MTEDRVETRIVIKDAGTVGYRYYKRAADLIIARRRCQLTLI